jgi:hypothetical protein
MTDIFFDGIKYENAMNDWINVWDNQPEKDVKVLICIEKKMHIAKCVSYNDGKEHIYFEGCDDEKIYEAQWWMHLPKPAEEDKNDAA